MLLGTISLLALAAGPVSAFWRLTCDHPLVVDRIDPIVNPGKVSGHLHTIVGGSNFNASMTYEDAFASPCSTCKIKQDLSNYWTPALFYKGQDGTFTPVSQMGGMTVYYLQRGATDPPTDVLAYPEGFRMLAGTPSLRNYTNTLQQQAISWVCLGATGAPRTKDLPSGNCPGGIRGQVFFPSCWDGVNLDSPDHKSHMAYPSRMNEGVCPPTHPKQMVSIFFEVMWATYKFKDQWYGSGQPFVLSQGDPTGYGFHGDFLNGWDVPLLQQAVDQCNSTSGLMEDCPLFEYFDDTTRQDCFAPEWVNEPTSGVLPSLPGCNPVQYGPAPAASKSGCGATTTLGPPQFGYKDLTASGWAYLGCGKDASSPRTLPYSWRNATYTITTMTNEGCVAGCASKGYTYAGTEYGSECWCGNSLAPGPAPIPGIMGSCTMPCKGDDAQTCGGSKRMSLYKKCSGSELCLNAAVV